MSIVAGVTVERLQNMIDGTPRILRLLPNTPAMVFEGAFALCSDNDLTEDELEAAKSIYSTIGVVEMIPEHLLDAACGLSGGGACLCSYVIEAMADGGVKTGTPACNGIPPCSTDLPWYCKDDSRKRNPPGRVKRHGYITGRNNHRRLRSSRKCWYAWCCN